MHSPIDYRFVARRRRGSHVTGNRLIFMGGEDAARLFYDERRFSRASAMPRRIQKTLFGTGGVQMLDGDEHKHRKALFISVMSPDSLASLRSYADESWSTAVDRWQRMDRVVLFTESAKLMLRTACAWTGVPLSPGEEFGRARDMVRMVDAFGAAGPRHWRGRVARRRSERWAAALVEAVRSGELAPPPGSGLDRVARHTDLAGRPLPVPVAAVELINLIRPTVAICWFVMYAAHALHLHPEWRDRLPADAEPFIQEVRRYYPFTPFLGARVREDFSWRQHEFGRGRLALLDVYGASHDPGVWTDPSRFDPSRFADRSIGSYEFIPQGGGDPQVTHRCPGEQVVIDVLKVSIGWLARLEYSVVSRDLEIPLSRLPSLVRDGFVITGVREPGDVREPGGVPEPGGVRSGRRGEEARR